LKVSVGWIRQRDPVECTGEDWLHRALFVTP
jgi:hypothetical protein